MNTWMCEEIHPEGWGDTWGMDSVTTASSIKLLEYKNTGPGSDMSGRATWSTLRAMTDEESLDYTVQKVMADADGWDPTAEPPMVQIFSWTGLGSSTSWWEPSNWNPDSIPEAGESAGVEGNYTISADGGTFAADLSIGNQARLDVTANSVVTYLVLDGSELKTSDTVSLGGKIATKDTSSIVVSGKLDVLASLYGVHPLYKSESGKLLLSADNSNYSGALILVGGIVEAKVANSLGKGSVTLKSGSTLTIDAENSLYVKSCLTIDTGATVVLNKPLVLNQVYIGGIMLSPGIYNASTHPAIFSGSESLSVGRPMLFTFRQASGKRWGTAANYIPALLPLAGDTAVVEIEMEADAVPYAATILLQKTNIRLVGNAVTTGDIIMSKDTKFTYATGGTGFSLNAGVKLTGDILLQMGGSSKNNAMTFTGSFTGSSVITAYNYGNTAGITARVLLNGDNSPFTGTWDGTRASRTSGNIAIIEGAAEKAFGSGKINMGSGNKVCFSHANAGGPLTELTLAAGTKAIMTTNGTVGKLTLGSTEYTSGAFNATSHPDYFEGTGTLTVSDETGLTPNISDIYRVFYDGNALILNKPVETLEVFNYLGQRRLLYKKTGTTIPLNLSSGLYIARLMSEGNVVTLNFVIN
jgi:hypothetical protein